MTGGGRTPGDGYFVEPTIIADVDPKARLAQEEVFGPVLAVIKAKNFDHAMEIANNTEFGLTGAVYSKNPAKIKRAEEEFHVGNLYLNPPNGCAPTIAPVHFRFKRSEEHTSELQSHSDL